MSFFKPDFPQFKIWYFIILLSSFSLAVLFKAFPLSRVCFRESCLYVELAKTQNQRNRGLMFRRHLAQDRGMLFVFTQDHFWSFWMKNTYIPLDIIWMDKDRKVVDIVKGVRPIRQENPPSFSPAFPARYVLEANAGFVEKNKIKIGDEVVFKWIFLSKEI